MTRRVAGLVVAASPDSAAYSGARIQCPNRPHQTLVAMILAEAAYRTLRHRRGNLFIATLKLGIERNNNDVGVLRGSRGPAKAGV